MCNSAHLFHVQNFKLEGLFLSKAKKIISMLLVVAMVLTVAPASMIASAYESNYTHGKLTFSKVNFTVDTSATTKVIRVAKAGTFQYGTDIISATPSGIPAHTGRYSALAYAGETPSYPKVVFTITGAALDEAPTVTSDKASSIQFGSMDKPVQNGDSYTYTVNVSGGTLNAGDNVTYTITYKVGGVTYTATAYAHAENFLRQNGVDVTRRRKTWNHSAGRMAVLFLIQGVNMYSGWQDNSQKTDRGYIDFSTSAPFSGNALKGLGCESGMSSAVDAFGKADNDTGTVRKFYEDSKTANISFGVANDFNRTESTVYMDKRSGSGTDTIKNLNMRMTMSVAEKADFGIAELIAMGTYDSEISMGDQHIAATTIPQWTVDTSTVRNLNAEDVGSADSWNGNYNLIPFGGTGPAYSSTTSDTFEWSTGFHVKGGKDYDTGHFVETSSLINVTYKVYDTTDLWNVYNGVRNGDGSSYTTTKLGYNSDSNKSANVSVTYNKGVNPQAGNYTAATWNAFNTAYNNAGIILATPDTNQTAINAATRALINAYNALAGFNPNVQFEIRHVIDGTNTELIPSQTSDPATGETTKPAGTVMSHAAATIEGYTVVGQSAGTTALSGQNAKETVTYSYSPKSYTVRVTANNDASTQDGYVVPTYQVTYGSEFALSTIDGDIGTKAGYTFGGWYYDSGTWAQPVPATFTMPASNVFIYAKWDLAPITLSVDLSAAGLDPVKVAEATPLEFGGAVNFAKPAFTDIEGYVFVDYYTDATYATKVTWPLSVTENTTVYARLENVNGKITFDSNGGTPVDTINYTSGNAVPAPQDPTREGYAFTGWFYDAECTQGVAADDGEIWKYGKSLTRNTMTGFVAYAGWEAQEVSVSFNVNIPASETSDFNTIAGSIPAETGLADSAFADGYQHPVPRRLGYEFQYWSYKNTDGKWHEFKFDKFPTRDIELRANWSATDYSAFIDVTAYQKLLGQDVEVTTAKRGDIVTFRMTSQTNFYTGSSVFVFMYDNRFFEPYKSGSDAFVLNSDNDYIKGISATHYGVTNNASLASKWPSGLDSANYNAMMIAIDPDVSVSHTTAPMNGKTWMLEFKLVIKDSATGSGKVYMDNAWTRTPDNIMGTMFYGWTKNATNVFETHNNVVIPDLEEATATVTLDETDPVMTTVTVKTNSTAFPGAAFADGDVEKTFTGRAGQEIQDYTSPVCAGYDLTGWVGENDATQTWIEGYYLPEGATETTYVAQWTPKNYTVNFYKHEGDETAFSTAEVPYNTAISAPSGTVRELGYTFAGWYYIDASGNKIDAEIPGMLCPLDGVNFYAKWEPAMVNYKIKAVYTDADTGEVAESYLTATTAFPMKALTGSYLDVVETAPETPVDNHNYILVSSLPRANIKYAFDAEDTRNYPLPTNVEVLADGTTEITLYYKLANFKITFNVGDNGTFADGTTEPKVVEAPYGTLIKNIAPEVIAKEGYSFTRWTGVNDNTAATADRTFNARFDPIAVDVIFDANGGTFSNGATQMTRSIRYNANITVPAAPTRAGYTFKGWSLDKDATEGSTSLGTLQTVSPTPYYAVYTAIDYNVIYTVNGETLYTDGPVHIGDVITVRGAESKEGYTFDGWYLNGVKVESITVETANVTLTGSFVANKYDVVFYNNDGTDASTKVSVAFDSAITAPAAPTRNGYIFKGWAATSTATEADIITDFGTLTTTAPAPYYAVWEADIADYYVDIYKQDVNGNYPATPDETITLSGKVGTVTDEYAPVDIAGFTADKANSVLSGTVTTAEAGALRLTVKYTRNKYNLVTVVDGTETSRTEYYYEAPVTAPADASKDGYTFAGWTPAVPATMPIPASGNDYVLTASFTVNKYTVKFYRDADATDAFSSYEADYDSAVVPASTTKTGYTFVGWAYKGTTEVLNFDDDANPIKVKIGDNEFVGIWRVNSYDLVYRPMNGGDNITYSVPYGTAAVDMPTPEDPVRIGYTFAGWSGKPETMPARNTNVIAQWTQNTYTIKFTNTGDLTVKDITGVYGASITAPADPVRTGYTFAGWYVAGTDTAYTIPATMPDITTEDKTLVLEARWTANSYTIIFKDADGTVYKQIDQDYDTDITAPDDPTKTGYTFAGWDTEVPAKMPVTPDSGLIITAKWTVNKYTMSFNSDGGTAVESKTYDFGAKTEAPAEPTKTGYTFAGWYLGDEAYIFGTMPANDVALVAHWTINEYTMSFNSDGGTAVESRIYAYGAQTEAPAAPTKEGYTFAGWYLGDEAYTFGTMPANNVELTAHWNVNTYKIVFVDSADTSKVYDTIELAYGTNIVAPKNPTKVGYTFAGWDADIPETMPVTPADGLVIKALWNVNNYTMSFDSDGGSAVADKVYAYGAQTEAPAAPTKKGYVFDGWYLGNEAYVFGTMPAENVALKAKWSFDKFTISFDSQGGTPVEAITQDYNSVVTAPAAPTKEGYTFAGWFLGDEAYTFTYMPAENITLTAHWTINSYRLKFVDAFGDDFSVSTVEFGAAITAPADKPAKEYYNFVGWSLNGTDVVENLGTMPANDLTVYPVFERVTVALDKVGDSTTVIDKENAHIQPPVTGYIYGLSERLTEEDLRANYIKVNGDGEIRVTKVGSFKYLGTGTKIEVVDRVTGEVVEIYYLIIFGDVNGDSIVNATDASIINREATGKTSWSSASSEAYDYCKVLAADADRNDSITADDFILVDDVTMRAAKFDQSTGEVIPNA